MQGWSLRVADVVDQYQRASISTVDAFTPTSTFTLKIWREKDRENRAGERRETNSEEDKRGAQDNSDSSYNASKIKGMFFFSLSIVLTLAKVQTSFEVLIAV